VSVGSLTAGSDGGTARRFPAARLAAAAVDGSDSAGLVSTESEGETARRFPVLSALLTAVVAVDGAAGGGLGSGTTRTRRNVGSVR
jgi:hypothetical protein